MLYDISFGNSIKAGLSLKIFDFFKPIPNGFLKLLQRVCQECHGKVKKKVLIQVLLLVISKESVLRI